MRAQGVTEESENVSKMSSLLERLHAKFNQSRTWSETIKLVRQFIASDTECYITSDMLYVEVQLDPAGQFCDVKVAHHGENPVSCPELVQQLRGKIFDEFSKHLKGLVNLYNLPGDNKLKTKMYLALQSLEQDLFKMAVMYWKVTNAGPLDKILHGSVGYLTPRSGGHLINLKYYASPSDMLDDKTTSPIVLHKNNVP
ncbi:hypothetical protein EI555_002553 [Monodon monoceros]|uniref:Mediator of RNA polymerase II transcription subunit 1 n=1 Tax=Monodon monoceros TaxID=40151 RepID=A0A4U1EPI0_MONMO|nr:hypothetical protein EI555_002553 [Monodon monoceros]